MKKQLLALLLAAVLLHTTTGCALASAAQKLDAAGNQLEATLEAAEDKAEDSLRQFIAADPAPVATKPEKDAPAQAENSGLLTKEQAQQIAFAYLGINQEQTDRLHTTFERDDGIPQYDVEFHQGEWEYEFEIHAENGQILSYDKDHKYD